MPTPSAAAVPDPTAARPGDVAGALKRLEAALQAGDLAGVSALLPGLIDAPAVPPGTLDPVVRIVAQHHLENNEPTRAAEGFARLSERTDADERLHTLARNLAALREHRPGLYRQVAARRAALQTLPFRFVNEPSSGRVLVAQATGTNNDQGGEGFALVPPGNQFDAFLEQARQTLQSNPEQPLALLGLGDGYAVTHLTKHPPELFMDMTVAVHVIEPDLDRLLAAMHLHDWADAALPGGGPWRDARFRWHVGPEWTEAYRTAWQDDPWTPQPGAALCPDPASAQALATALRELSEAYQALGRGLIDHAKQRYAERDEEAWWALFGDDPPRKPRMVVLTSRFTTVLQYASRDTAAALERLGWDVRFVIEDQPHQRMNILTFGRMLTEFEPDALLCIDSTRHAMMGWVPDELPCVCWVQDALPRLMNEQLGKAIGPRDFILTFFAPRLIHDHAYPARQCLDMPMMVTTPRTGNHPKTRGKNGSDLIYASNVSGTVDVLRTQTCERAPAELRGLTEVAAGLLIAHYEHGDALPTEPDIDTLLDEAVESGALPGHDASTRRTLRDALWNPLNTGLYRQQALGWVVDQARARGLSLHLHGHGWEDHPRFAAYARGPLSHGQLQAATAAARFALHLEPYVCFTHHRLLDATQAGTPVLIRDHPGNRGLSSVARFLFRHCPSARDDRGAREALKHDATQSAQLETLLATSRGLTWDLSGDVVAQVRAWQRAGVLGDGSDAQPPLPHLQALSFDGPATLGERLDALLADPDRVETILADQREIINERFTFDAALRRVIARMHGLLTQV